MIKNWNTDILKDEDRVYDSKDDINRLIKVIPLLGEGIIQMKTSTRNLMINGLPLDGKLYKTDGHSATSGIVEVVPEGMGYVYHMAKSGTTQGAWYIKSTDTTSISQLPYVKEDTLFTNMLIKGSGTATLQFLDKDDNVLSEMITPALTDNYQAFNVKGQLKDSVWSFRITASDAIYFKQVMITRSSFPSDYMLSEEELEQLNIINTSNIDANTVTKSHAYQVIGLKSCPANVSTSGIFINIQKDNFAQVFVPNDDTGIYYRVGVTTNRPNTKWTRLATSDNTYSKEDFTEMRTSDNINLIQDSSMSAGFWAFYKDDASTSVGSLDTAEGIAHITGNGISGSSGAQYQVASLRYQQPLLQNSEIQYEQEYTVSVETTWSEGADIASNGEVPPSLIVCEQYKDGTGKEIIRVRAVDKYGYNKWHKLSGTFKFSENRKNDISFIQVILLWKGAKGDVYFRRPKLEMANLPSAYTDDTIASVEPNHNLLQDSRDLLNGWIKNGSKVSLDDAGDMAWYQGMRVQHQFGDWSYYGTKNKLTLENGKYYTVSAYMRGSHEGDLNMYATILSDKSNNGNLLFPLAKHLTGDWRRYSYTFKFDESTQVVNIWGIRIEGQGNWDSPGGSAYVAGIKLEEGKTATDWSPSIEETIVRYETQNWQKDKITADNGDLALRVNVSGTDPIDKQFLSATGTKTFYIQGGATGNNTGDSLRGILIKDSPSFGNAYGITNNNELWFLKIQDSKLTPWSKVAKEADVMTRTNVIPKNADLNDYQKAGFYYTSLIADAQTMKNLPIEEVSAFTLEVTENSGCTQKWYNYQTSHTEFRGIYIRNFDNSTWSDWRVIPLQDAGIASVTGNTNFNYYAKSGTYTVATSTAVNAPTSGGLYGFLQVFGSDNTPTGGYKLQVYRSATGDSTNNVGDNNSEIYIRNYSGGTPVWSNWVKLANGIDIKKLEDRATNLENRAKTLESTTAQLRTDVNNINSYQKIDIGSLQNTNGNIFLETQHGIAHLHIQALFSTTNNTKGAFTAFTIPKAFAPKYAFSSTLGFNIDIQHQDLVYSVYEDGRFSVVNNSDDSHQVIGTITWFY